MTFRRFRLLSCLGILGMAGVLLTAVPPNLAADKTKKPDSKSSSKSSSKSKEKGDSAKTPADDSKSDDSADSDDTEKKVKKTDAEWRKQLTPMQFKVTRKKGTEQAFTGIYAHTKKDGIYRCVCCGQPLFDSKTKFDSGTGWPSFFQPLTEKAVNYIDDNSAGELRIEVECSHCDAHLGHVFDDGPEPTGQRFCMNSASLKLVSRDSVEKEAKAKKEKAKSAASEKPSAKSDDKSEKK